MGWFPKNKDLREFDQLHIPDKYLNWYEIPLMDGFTFHTQRGYLQGVGIDIQNDLKMEARSCIFCDDKSLNFDENEYITRVEVSGGEKWGISNIKITTNKRTIEEESNKVGDDSETQIFDLYTSQRVVGFKSWIEFECVKYWAPDNN